MGMNQLLSKRLINPLRRSCALLLPLACLHCQVFTGGMQVESVAHQAQRPSNVAVYLSVQNNGRPQTELQADNFKVYEDGLVLDSTQVQLTLLDESESV